MSKMSSISIFDINWIREYYEKDRDYWEDISIEAHIHIKRNLSLSEQACLREFFYHIKGVLALSLSDFNFHQDHYSRWLFNLNAMSEEDTLNLHTVKAHTMTVTVSNKRTLATIVKFLEIMEYATRNDMEMEMQNVISRNVSDDFFRQIHKRR